MGRTARLEAKKERPHDETGGRLPRVRQGARTAPPSCRRRTTSPSRARGRGGLGNGQEELILSKKDRAAVGAKAVKAANELLAKTPGRRADALGGDAGARRRAPSSSRAISR